MKEHYVTYDCVVKLKELGFDWKVRGYYTCDDNFQKVREVTALNHNDTKKFKNILSAPRLDQAQAWLRETKHIYVYPEINCLKKWFAKAVDMERNEDLIWDGTMFDTYESALSAGIDKALELLTNKLNRE